jgi:hypothetical protein
MKIMKSRFRKVFGIFLLISGSLILIGSFSSYDPFMVGFGILQLVVAVPLLFPLVLEKIRRNSSGV